MPVGPVGPVAPDGPEGPVGPCVNTEGTTVHVFVELL
jgi:hypothetical protein